MEHDRTGALAPGDRTSPAGPDLLARARAEDPAPGQYLVHERENAPVLVALDKEWTRIGRSMMADIRFDDTTVSRRHALVVRGPGGVRVLDDGSLNGVFVNGERVEWQALRDGDEITVGRHRLVFLDQVAAPHDPAPEPLGARHGRP